MKDCRLSARSILGTGWVLALIGLLSGCGDPGGLVETTAPGTGMGTPKTTSAGDESAQELDSQIGELEMAPDLDAIRRGEFPDVDRTPIKVIPLEPGQGDPIGPGQQAVFDYEFRLYSNRFVEGSMGDEAKMLRFQLGAGEVPPGLEIGVNGMTPGEQRELIIPPAYLGEDVTLGGKVGPGQEVRLIEAGPVEPLPPPATDPDDPEAEEPSSPTGDPTETATTEENPGASDPADR